MSWMRGLVRGRFMGDGLDGDIVLVTLLGEAEHLDLDVGLHATLGEKTAELGTVCEPQEGLVLLRR